LLSKSNHRQHSSVALGCSGRDDLDSFIAAVGEAAEPGPSARIEEEDRAQRFALAVQVVSFSWMAHMTNDDLTSIRRAPPRSKAAASFHCWNELGRRRVENQKIIIIKN